MMSLGELQISFFAPKIHLLTSYPDYFERDRVMKMRISTIKTYYIRGPVFFLEYITTDYLFYQMSHFAKFLSQTFDMHARTDASVRHFVGKRNPRHTT